MHVIGTPIFVLLAFVAVAMVGFGMVVVVWKVAAFLFGALFASPGPRPPIARGPSPADLQCRNDRCRFVNRPGARYCARCGVSLGLKPEVGHAPTPPDVNTYG